MDSDCAHFFTWVSSANALLLWVGRQLTYPLDADQLYDYLVAHDIPTARLYTAVDADSGPVGHIGLRNISPAAGFARIVNVIVSPAHRRTGIGRKMVMAALRIGFDEMGLHRIDLNAFEFNEPAIRCYERCGFVKEGVLREAVRADDGSYWSMLQMSILEPEWRRISDTQE